MWPPPRRTTTKGRAGDPWPWVTYAGIAVVHAAAATVTWRDLRDRPATRVRGDKRYWRAASAINTLGSVAYWTVGRVPETRQRSKMSSLAFRRSGGPVVT